MRLPDGGGGEDNEPVSAFSPALKGDSAVIAANAPGSGVAVDPAKALTGSWTPELRNGADDFRRTPRGAGDPASRTAFAQALTWAGARGGRARPPVTYRRGRSAGRPHARGAPG
ncbi:hypothetical protein [Streptomyces sp. DSM 118148]|uniref:hypothetical protein n=1 Tax=Streptomyces sp. DSM 118148 TaxID=3448667 RepID=UPI00403FDCE1